MSKKNITLTLALGLTLVNGVFASNPKTEKDEFDINSVIYIETEDTIDLGFDVADYLPEHFDPYKQYVDLDAIAVVEDEFTLNLDTTQYLPQDFDAYANPKDIQSINYIDENDEFSVNFDTKKYLPQDFNAFSK